MGGRLSDLKILLQSRSRDAGTREECFKRIWGEYYPKISVFVKGYAASEGDGEDLAQEIMEKVFRGLDSYDPSRAFSTWIYTVARNHCLDAVRRRGRAPRQVMLSELPDRAQPAHDGTPESGLLDREEEERVRRFMDAADPETRQLAFLRFRQRLGCAEISRIMGIPAGTVKFRLHRLRQDVRAHMEAEG